MEKIAIVILNFNGEKNTIQCLESLNKLQVVNYKLEVIVVDNGSEKEFRIEHLKIIRNKHNLGFS